jgi:hypothetical protein
LKIEPTDCPIVRGNSSEFKPNRSRAAYDFRMGRKPSRHQARSWAQPTQARGFCVAPLRAVPSNARYKDNQEEQRNEKDFDSGPYGRDGNSRRVRTGSRTERGCRPARTSWAAGPAGLARRARPSRATGRSRATGSPRTTGTARCARRERRSRTGSRCYQVGSGQRRGQLRCK